VDASITASDALWVLSAAVGTNDCPPCACDIGGNATITAGDALVLLRIAVGQNGELECPTCGAALGTISAEVTVIGRTLADLKVRAVGPVRRQQDITDGVPTVMDAMPSGSYEIELLGVPEDCEVDAVHPRTVGVTDGGSLNEEFTVRCGDPSCAIGGKIAFHSRRDQTFDVLGDIFVLDLDGGGPELQLMATPENEHMPALTLTGDTLAYARVERLEVGVGDVSIELIEGPFTSFLNASSVLAPRARYARAPNVADVTPNWSNDGTMLAVSSNRASSEQENNFDIFVADRRLTSSGFDDSDPSFSHDDTQVVFQSGRNTGAGPGLYITEVDGVPGDERRIVASPARAADWSPVDDLILFESNGNVSTVRSDGSDKRFIPYPADQGIAGMFEPHWSKDGEWIVFRAEMHEEFDSELFIMRPDGSCVRRLTTNDVDDIQPSWGG